MKNFKKILNIYCGGRIQKLLFKLNEYPEQKYRTLSITNMTEKKTKYKTKITEYKSKEKRQQQTMRTANNPL